MISIHCGRCIDAGKRLQPDRRGEPVAGLVEPHPCTAAVEVDQIRGAATVSATVEIAEP